MIRLLGVGPVLVTMFLSGTEVQDDSAKTSQGKDDNAPNIPASLSGWVRPRTQKYK